MSNPFFDQPILNSPYAHPARHWELDSSGQPTQVIKESRRQADFITPIPKPRKHKGGTDQASLVFDEGQGLSTEEQQYDHTAVINAVREKVDKWRTLPPSAWRVTPETARLLQHWRSHPFSGIRPFFCQVEAVETAIWLTEVAPQLGKSGQRFLDQLSKANIEANPNLSRLALKLATGAGKTTVMAMLIAWQTINAVRRPNSSKFTRGFLIVAPGLTIKDRLRVLLPNDTESYYAHRELVPSDMLPDIAHARIVITNYHAFRLRERLDVSSGGRRLLQGRGGAELQTLETEGQMLQRVLPELMGLKKILAINDEAHHCYREKPLGESDEDEDLKVNGVDVFHPNSGQIRSDGAGGIACWFIDTDYNEESFFVRHAYFLGANDPYKALKTTLKAEIDANAWASLNSDTSRPFDKPKSGRIAVKVINHLGDEVMKVFKVQ